MKRILFLLALLCLEKTLHAQTPHAPYIYTIKADSVKITNTCDTAELIIENHTQTVPGFLFNKGRGRTEFRRVMQGINDTMVMIGPDTLRLHNAWLQGGNRFGTTGVFGTIDYNHVDFYSGGVPRARLTNNGPFQIGNSSSDNGEKLQVYGNIYSNGSRHLLGYLAIVSGMDAVYAGSSVGIRVDHFDYGSLILQSSTKGHLHDMFVFDAGITGLGKDVYTDDQSIIRIKSGIKSNNKPDNSLSVVNIQPEYKLEQTSAPLTIRGIYYKPTLTNTLDSRHIAIETVTGDVLLATTSGNMGVGTNMPTAQLHTTGTVRFGGLTNNNSLTRIVVSDANGNLYYKDASSALNGALNSDLTVNGTVSAQKMLIAQAGRWPDYVFSKQYQLPSLTEVENFIHQNSHLPDISSAAEVEKNGIDVANNQAALLKKIEELTLYIIEQEKTIQKQNDQIKDLLSLKQEIAELKTLIKNTNQPVK